MTNDHEQGIATVHIALQLEGALNVKIEDVIGPGGKKYLRCTLVEV